MLTTPQNVTADGTLLVPVVDVLAVQREVEAQQRDQERKQNELRALHAQKLEEEQVRAQQELEAEQRLAEQAFASRKEQVCDACVRACVRACVDACVIC
jgi:hypothetical protein